MKAKRWQEYFGELLNGGISVTPIPAWEDQRAEQEVKDISLDETLRAINRLKNWKAAGSDGIPAELIKYGGLELHKTIYELCSRIWNEEIIPEEWNKAIVIPIHKKGDKMNCKNYRGISLLNTVKVFSKILLGRLEPLAEECMGNYQCGFRKANPQ